MIDITKLTEADKGREVCYTPTHGPVEYGRISSWNDYYIFVRYGNNAVGTATSPAQLDWC